MIFEFENFIEGTGGQLKCPACKGIYLHHERIDIFERTEDSEKGLHVAVESLKVTTDDNLEGNPSDRREGLTIVFRCEKCNAKPVLSLSQHKGNTWINFK